ncbi:MAG: tRNA epoxyqueuosine(34) reductase QueG [Chloroflexi bacterium HGW-Chloroflexi-3]|nr:MAG: tRNA epoxyqueuosine(34) reductase QueG [Chloroflexi bacterium HGW-Chloroflexi-3]
MDLYFQGDLQSIKNEIKTEAECLGFSHIGFTIPDNPVHFDTYLEWIINGYAAEMEYLKRPESIARRKDPKLIIPACKSIIVVAMPYTPSGFEKRDYKFPKIANYAIGDDYHIIIPVLLEKLVKFIISKVYPVEVEYRIYTDTGPILEKETAQKAGLGWIGKNTCLIIPGAGSFFFLAEILINLPFDPDSIFEKDFCGNCTRCIDSCPTNCILQNRTIDANRCISYLTIENRGAIPEEFRKKLNGWIFGCDICQQVCLWNIKFSKEPEPNFFKTSVNIQKFDIISELKLDKSEFKNKYSKSPIYRAKYDGYKRNLLIAAGNNFNTELLDPINNIMKNDENPEIRELAAWVLKNK